MSEKLKQCAKCPTTLYCNLECQKAGWKQHKQICAGKQVSLGRHTPGFDFSTTFAGRDKKYIFTQLVDCFRMRCEDERNWVGNLIGSHNEAGDQLPDFKLFLDLAESRRNLLPA
jgi:mitochondrial splicing suppressor protein 51